MNCLTTIVSRLGANLGRICLLSAVWQHLLVQDLVSAEEILITSLRGELVDQQVLVVALVALERRGAHGAAEDHVGALLLLQEVLENGPYLAPARRLAIVGLRCVLRLIDAVTRQNILRVAILGELSHGAELLLGLGALAALL